MTAIPSLLSSAQSALDAGFSRLNSAANQIVSSTLTDPSTPDPATTTPTDPLLGGLFDLTSARTNITAGALLLNTYNRTTQDLMNTLDPNRPYSQKTYDSFSTYA